MRFASRVALGCLIALSCAAMAHAATDISVRVDIGGAPPAPHIVFRAEPHVVYERAERVYVVDDPACGDADCFHYGPYWYTFSNGYWYRAARWRGPFVVVHPRYVPEALYRVPPGHWKHRAMREAREMRREARREDRREDRRDFREERRDARFKPGRDARDERGGNGHDNGRGHGNGHGKGNGKGHGHDGENDGEETGHDHRR
jgi:hypothetical protein